MLKKRKLEVVWFFLYQQDVSNLLTLVENHIKFPAANVSLTAKSETKMFSDRDQKQSQKLTDSAHV